MNDTLEYQGAFVLSDLLGFDPGSSYYRIMIGMRERILMEGQEKRLIYQHGPRIFPEEFKEFQSIIRGQSRTDGHRERYEWNQK